MTDENTNTEKKYVAADCSNERFVMLPLRDDESGHCSSDCPFLKAWDHPFWHHTGWCWKQMRDLDWHDYWLADCIDNDPEPNLVPIRNGQIVERMYEIDEMTNEEIPRVAHEAAAELIRIADDLKLSSTIDEWDGTEEEAKEEYDRLMDLARRLLSA